jgi:hypothetical protein
MDLCKKLSLFGGVRNFKDSVAVRLDLHLGFPFNINSSRMGKVDIYG